MVRERPFQKLIIYLALVLGFVLFMRHRQIRSKETNQGRPTADQVQDKGRPSPGTDGRKDKKPLAKAEETEQLKVYERLRSRGEESLKGFNQKVPLATQQRIIALTEKIAANPRSPEAVGLARELKRELDQPGVREGIAIWQAHLRGIGQEGLKTWDSRSKEQRDTFGAKGPSLGTREELKQHSNRDKNRASGTKP